MKPSSPQASPSTGLPYIADQVGLPILLQPYVFTDSTMAIFVLDCQAASLNQLLDTYINKPSGDRFAYRCLRADGKAFAMMIMAQMTVNGRNPAGVEYGKERYSELSFWIPCYDQNALKQWKFRPALFLPFLFPDSFAALATGREMFGFRKQPASFAYPSGKLDVWNPQFTATTTAFKELGPDSVAQRYDFVSLPEAQSDVRAGEKWNEGAFASSITDLFLGKNWTSETGEVLGVINELLGDMPAIFLKQFPGISGAQEAESRDITSAPFQLLAFHGGFPWLKGLSPKVFELQFARLASHPIVSQLGLTPSSSTNDVDTVPAKGFWVSVDFGLDTGKTQESVRPPKQKIAVLGGGIGSLAAVYGLTQDPAFQEKYEVTLYQMGWRLGGKGASGRNRELANRIEEHGLHVWFGYYENAFRMIQACYEELSRPSNVPLATWDQAFRPHSTILVEEYVNGAWRHWPLSFRPNLELPGQGKTRTDHPLAFFGHLRQAGEWLHQELAQLLERSEKAQAHARNVAHGQAARTVSDTVGAAVRFMSSLSSEVKSVLSDAEKAALQQFFADFQRLYETFPRPGTELEELLAIAKSLESGGLQHWLDVLKELQILVQGFLAPFAQVFDSIRRFLTLFELGVAIGLGILKDGVLLGGYSAINSYDFTQWLIKNGASEAAANSAFVRSFYDLYLAFPNGKATIVDGGVAIGGNVSAGELLHSYVLVTLCYKGAIMWKMQAGMGDTVMTPLYQVLKQRGVRFEFFHKVTDLRLTQDNRIGEIAIDVQATLKPNVAEYNPLFDVKGLPCWPSAPLYEQLEQGQALKQQQINLESSWTPWQPVAKKTLQLGKDFDQVVLGISVAALPYITSQLSAANPQWKAMLDNATTSQTLAMQLWLNITLEETGWPLPSPILDAYAEPFNTWAVMDQTLDKESWPQNQLPHSIAYFCNNMADANPIPPFSDHGFPARQEQVVREAARTWLSQYTGHLWPYAVQKNGRTLDWSTLVDLENRIGEARLDGQYFRANIDPTERYVCNAANTNQYRLKAGGSGFPNLYLAGDWIDNGSLNLGNVESTVISGLQAAEAITGLPLQIHRDG